MKDLQKLFELCKNELRVLDIPFCEDTTCIVNSRAKRRWGLCTKKPDGSYIIEISYRLLTDDVPDKSTKTTILHELLHTVPGGNCHTGAWKFYATKVNTVLGYNISRTTSAAEKGVEEFSIINNYKYFITCDKCGYVWKRTRATAVTAHPEHYHCHCGGNLKVTEL